MSKHITVAELLKALSMVDNKAAKVVVVDVDTKYSGHVVRTSDLSFDCSRNGFIHIFVDIAGQNPEGV